MISRLLRATIVLAACSTIAVVLGPAKPAYAAGYGFVQYNFEGHNYDNGRTSYISPEAVIKYWVDNSNPLPIVITGQEVCEDQWLWLQQSLPAGYDVDWTVGDGDSNGCDGGAIGVGLFNLGGPRANKIVYQYQNQGSIDTGNGTVRKILCHSATALPFAACSTHTTASSSATTRLQVKEAWYAIEYYYSSISARFMGADFNLTPEDTDPLNNNQQIMRAYWYSTYYDADYEYGYTKTYDCYFNNTWKIDFMFGRKGTVTASPPAYVTCTNPWSSDHKFFYGVLNF